MYQLLSPTLSYLLPLPTTTIPFYQSFSKAHDFCFVTALVQEAPPVPSSAWKYALDLGGTPGGYTTESSDLLSKQFSNERGG